MSRLPQHQTPPRAGRPKSCRPFSWLLTRDVEQGREKLNFSTWDEEDGVAGDAVAEGSMPPRRSGGG
jgi:hypothetical protein